MTVKEMTAQELARVVLNKQKLFILDVRNESDYSDWRIEGDRIATANIPYFDLLDGVEAAMAAIPQGEPVLVVCAKEGSSRFVAEQLALAGAADVRCLQGGMKMWGEHVEPVKVGELQGGGALYQFIRPGKGCLSYMIMSGGEAAVVDALRMTEVYENFAEQHQVRIRHAIDTHLHADHISGGRKLAERTGATYWLPPKDAQEVVFNYAALEDGELIAVGNSAIGIQAIYSPGHTIGSTSFVVDNRYLLTGDILFVASIGRPDLAGLAQDWVGNLRDTLYKRYKELSGELIVLPAHFGHASELGEGGVVSAPLRDLFDVNPGLNIRDEAAFRRTVTEQLPKQPNAYQEIRQTNMGRLEPDDEQQREMETGPNRCAVHDR